MNRELMKGAPPPLPSQLCFLSSEEPVSSTIEKQESAEKAPGSQIDFDLCRFLCGSSLCHSSAAFTNKHINT